jgi:predicted nuclease of predicted toxin-antitoxin system
VNAPALGLAQVSDAEVWAFACERACAVISKDDDFLYLSRQAETRAGFLWVRMGNCRTAALLAEFERLWPQIQAALVAGDRIIELC